MLSIVVPTRARSARLLLTLSSLLTQSVPVGGFEVVVVDDAPDPGRVDAVLDMLPSGLDLRVTHTGGRGVAAARNAGARLARGSLLLFLDDDTVCSPNLLAAHVATQQQSQLVVAHSRIMDLTAFRFTDEPWPLPAPSLAGARGRCLSVDDLTDLAAVAPTLGPRRSFIERMARRATDGQDVHRPLRWLACIGTATSVRREVFDDVGGFDEFYGSRWGGEDLELGLRLAQRGADFAIIDPVGYHLPMARRAVDVSLTEFWKLVADRHDNTALVLVGEFLRGQRSLEELAGRIAAGEGRSRVMLGTDPR